MTRKMSTEFDAFLDMLRHKDYVVLDTETTGLEVGEICSIAIINNKGERLLDTFVRTMKPIPVDATAIHGITDAKVALSPRWSVVQPKVLEIIEGKDVVIFNAVYDRKMMHQSDEIAIGTRTDYKLHARFWCAMTMYAEYYGDWNDYRQSYRWQSLAKAMQQQGLIQNNAHSALDDCLATLALCIRMSAREFTEAEAVQEALDEEDLGLSN